MTTGGPPPPPGDNPPPGDDPPGGRPPGTTGGASGSSGSSGPSDAERMAMARLRASYREILRRWGIRPSRNTLNLMEKGLRNQWSTTQFIDFLRQTPEYRQQFRGIRWRQGMSEGQYNAQFAQYKEAAADLGEHLTRKEFGKVLKRGLDFEEFTDRLNAINSIETYAPFWGEFQQALQLRGVAVPGKNLTKKELTDFVMGLGDPKWEKVWQEVYLTVQLERVAGISVTAPRAGETAEPDTYDLSRKDMLAIINQVESLSPGRELEALGSVDYAQLGTFVRSHSIEYMRRWGLTTKDLITSQLGGPNAAKIAERSQRVLATQQAFQEPRATPVTPLSAQSQQPTDEELPQSL